MLSRQLGLNLKPYRRSGEHVLLVGQNPGDASLRGLDMFDWLNKRCSSSAKPPTDPSSFGRIRSPMPE